MRIIPQHDYDKPACPRSGIAGGPIHPAHAMEVIIADRVYSVVPGDADGEVTPEFDAVISASSRQGGMELYRSVASPIQSGRTYFSAAFFYCLACGFALPAQEMPRSS